MKKVAIIAYDNVPLSSLALPTDTLQAAGVLWNRIFKEQIDPQFTVEIATFDGKPIRCKGSVSITPHCALSELYDIDLLIVSPVDDVTSSFMEYSGTIEYIRQYHAAGTAVASICTGAFLLAATGLLDGRKATTHWGLTGYFANRFPKVRLEPQNTVTEDNNLFCSGGANAGADLSLHLIRKYCGSQVAYHCARALLIDPSRISQAPYEIFHLEKNHGDEQVATIQSWIEANYHQELQVDTMVKKVAMSRRTFERRFKNATGDSPLRYLQRVRVESAKLMLETGQDTFEQITNRVGYEDTSSFRRVFQKTTGLAPSSYREKFRVTTTSP